MKSKPLREWERFDVEKLKEVGVDTKTAKRWFEELEDFAKSEKNSPFLAYSKKGELKVKNYVGIIQTQSGVLEILPKIGSSSDLSEKDLAQYYTIGENGCFKRYDKGENNREDFVESSRKLLVNLLRYLKNAPFKNLDHSSLGSKNSSIFEIFIQMFCEEFDRVYQKGLKRDYVSLEDNRFCVKGKILFGQQVRYNLVHKERFYTASDEFVLDIPENALIKKTLEFLKNKTSLYGVRINTALQKLEEINSSFDIEKDFEKCKNISRHFSYYETILSWCKLFLKGSSFSPFNGDNKAYALLFPMEKIFEDYVAVMLKKHNPDKIVKIQSSSKYLTQTKNKENLFCLKPDIIIENKDANKEVMILDTKWKIPKGGSDKKYGVSQDDLYQMLAYATKFKALKTKLIYPDNPETRKTINNPKLFFKASDCLKFCDEERKIELELVFLPLPFK